MSLENKGRECFSVMVVSVVKYGSVLKKKKCVAKEHHQHRTLIRGWTEDRLVCVLSNCRLKVEFETIV